VSLGQPELKLEGANPFEVSSVLLGQFAKLVESILGAQVLYMMRGRGQIGSWNAIRLWGLRITAAVRYLRVASGQVLVKEHSSGPLQLLQLLLFGEFFFD
jgi:hypothetical protein